MGQPDKDLDLNFTAHFETVTVRAEKIPVAEKVVLDPDFRIGASKFEDDSFFVAVARRNLGTIEAAASNKVMFVEDEPVTNAVLKKVLATDGFEAHGAFDAAGLGKMLKQHGLPGIILPDIELPSVNGLQILSRIRKHPKVSAIPVLMIASRAEMSDVVRGLSLGANAYLSKPVVVESLRAILRQILGRLPENEGAMGRGAVMKVRKWDRSGGNVRITGEGNGTCH